MSNLLLTVLDKAGVEIGSFADSSGKIEQLAEPVSL
jgi:hypothetical protein